MLLHHNGRDLVDNCIFLHNGLRPVPSCTLPSLHHKLFVCGCWYCPIVCVLLADFQLIQIAWPELLRVVDAVLHLHLNLLL